MYTRAGDATWLKHNCDSSLDIVARQRGDESQGVQIPGADVIGG
jgi:hypothetical protein